MSPTIKRRSISLIAATLILPVTILVGGILFGGNSSVGWFRIAGLVLWIQAPLVLTRLYWENRAHSVNPESDPTALSVPTKKLVVCTVLILCSIVPILAGMTQISNAEPIGAVYLSFSLAMLALALKFLSDGFRAAIEVSQPPAV